MRKSKGTLFSHLSVATLFPSEGKILAALAYLYDVAWSDNRKPGADGKLPPVGNTVDVKHANWTNTIGASELGMMWTDPDFNPKNRAFYYTRVIEIPTPRRVVYDAFR